MRGNPPVRFGGRGAAILRSYPISWENAVPETHPNRVASNHPAPLCLVAGKTTALFSQTRESAEVTGLVLHAVGLFPATSLT